VVDTSAIGRMAPAERESRLSRIFYWVLYRVRPAPVSFPELTLAHFERQQELEAGGDLYTGRAEVLYRRLEAAFEARYGPIVNSYWCSTEASGVALTVKSRPGIIPDVIRLHWATDWTTKALPKLDDLLFRCETLAVRVTEVLRDTSKRIALQRVFNSMSFILGFAEAEGARDAAVTKKAVEAQNLELEDIERYYHDAKGRSGQIVYLGGTLLGVLPFLAIALLAAIFGAFGAGHSAVRTGAVCFAAGAVGALVSVTSRMNQHNASIDPEFGRDTVRTLGSLRPFVGAVFGLMTYFALRSGLVSLVDAQGKTFYFYVVLSFVAGFSERLAQDMLLRAAFPTGASKTDGPSREPLRDAHTGRSEAHTSTGRSGADA
jgi:hypothetical protein